MQRVENFLIDLFWASQKRGMDEQASRQASKAYRAAFLKTPFPPFLL